MAGMELKDAIKAMNDHTPVVFMGDTYHVVDFRKWQYKGTVYIVRYSLNHNYDPIEIEPMYLERMDKFHEETEEKE